MPRPVVLPASSHAGRAVRTVLYRSGMPQWVVLLAIAIGCWLALSVVGGLLIGRLLAAASRRYERRARAWLEVVESAGQRRATPSVLGGRRR